MIRGIEVFREHFADYNGQYVLIGGSACDIVFNENAQPFRATKDLDIVLIAEALTSEFVRHFWAFIKHGEYMIRQRKDGNPIFYRFCNPENKEFPKEIELFSRDDRLMQEHLDAGNVIKIILDEDVSGLSAILLNDVYYKLIREGTIIIDGIPVLSDAYLLLCKAKAWLDLSKRKHNGESIDSSDIRKHKNDIVRLSMLLFPDQRVILPEEIKKDIAAFLSAYEANPADLRQLGIVNVENTGIIKRLKEYYNLENNSI